MNIGERILNLRKSKNLTQQDLAKKIFVTDKTISSWESNRTEPSLEMILKLSEVFECAVTYLIYGDILRNDIETEIKIKLTEEEYKKLDLFMKKNAKYLTESKQKDTYYQPIHRNFIKETPIKEWLRIGERGNKKILNYKNWYDVYCDEYEVEFDNLENLKKIFDVLNFEKIAIVDKVRNTYMYLNKYEVALDIVKNLGYYVEIEVKNYNKPIIEEYEALLKLTKDLKLNLDKIDKRGYPYYLINKN